MTTRYAAKAFDPTSLPIAEIVERRRLSVLASNINVPIGETVADTDIFGRIPSCAKIEPGSKLYNAAITGLTSYDLGLYVESTPMVPDLTKGAAACLIAAKDIHTASSQDFSTAITPALGDKFAWELAGLASDPGGSLLVVGTVHSAGGTASAAGYLDLHLAYRTS